LHAACRRSAERDRGQRFIADIDAGAAVARAIERKLLDFDSVAVRLQRGFNVIARRDLFACAGDARADDFGELADVFIRAAAIGFGRAERIDRRRCGDGRRCRGVAVRAGARGEGERGQRGG